MSYVTSGHILGQAEKYQEAANAPEHKSSMDQDAFLKLLVAQLTNQDPMKPMEDKEMTAQLAQFSQLEQLTSIDAGIEEMNESQADNDMMLATSFIGKGIKAQGYEISKDGDAASTIFYSMGQDVNAIRMNIYDEDGAIVRTVTIGAKQAGTYEYVWDGKDHSGVELPDGRYSVGLLGETPEGKQVMITTEVAGEVSGVVTENDNIYMRFSDGRFINYKNIVEVVDPDSEFSGETDDPDSSEGDTES